MKMKLNRILLVGLFALTAVAVVDLPGVRSHVTAQIDGNDGRASLQPLSAPRIEVVFVLDTTGSMSGLIEAAQEKIWSIASTMASAQPAPEIRMGLVAYRDRGDEYITRVVDLSHDLDTMYATLLDFEADGGGDGPESVNQALYDALHRISWSQDGDSYRVIFLVGDAPPHMDYPDDVKYPQTLAAATRQGIVVNTIRCGADPATEHQWRQIAALNQGQYFSVEQGGSAIAMATPYDEELARLSADLDGTRLYYGDEKLRQAKQRKIDATGKLHAGASPAAKARRAAFNASASGEPNQFGEGDLVSDVAAGRVDLESLEAERLPESLQALAPEERAAAVVETDRKRAALRERIAALADQRESYLSAQVEATGEKDESLDHRLFEVVRSQAQAKGMAYEGAPKY